MTQFITPYEEARLIEEIGITNRNCKIVFHHVTSPQYMQVSKANLWDTPLEWVVIRLDDAHHGLCIYGRYGEGEDARWEVPWGARPMTRVFLAQLGVHLPMPTTRANPKPPDYPIH